MKILHKILFIKEWRKQCLSVLSIFALLILAVVLEPIKLDSIPEIVKANQILTAIVIVLVLLPLSIISFFYFLKDYFIFREDIYNVFPLSFIIYLSFWALINGTYFTLTLAYQMIPLSPKNWDIAAITACLGLSLLATSGISVIGKIRIPWVKNDAPPVETFHKSHKNLMRAVSNQKRRAKENPASIKMKDKKCVEDEITLCETLIQKIINWEKDSAIKNKYERLRRDLSYTKERLSSINAHDYCAILREEYGYDQLSKVLKLIIELNYKNKGVNLE